MNIEEIKTKIKSNYSELSEKRKINNKPVFSIEHNLSEEEYSFLISYIRSCKYIEAGDDLIWIVYATEIGYEIERIEYWDSFHYNLSIDSLDYDHRKSIQSFFNDFIREYNGYQPQGSFAEHRSIISLPIYNSILPKYLQNNLAKLLHICRHSFEDYKNRDHRKFGKFLSDKIQYYNFNFSKLFHNFSQDEEMLGKIAYALIDENADNYYDDIDVNTFKRIISDCEQVREAKEWLNSSRSAFRKIKFKGFRKNIASIYRERKVEEASNVLKDCFIKPKIRLIKEKNDWKSYLRFEPFDKNFLKVYIEFREVFLHSYCIINNDNEFKINAKKLLRSANEILISKWIDYSKRLIEFKSEKNDPLIDQLNFTLQNESFLVDDKIWLFKVSEFSYANEVVGKTILPNSNYLIISKENLQNKLLTEEKILTEGVKAYSFITKESFTKEDMEALRELNLFPYSKIIFKPIGYPPQNFDDEESSSWTINDNPCFKVETDQPIEKIFFNFQGQSIEKNNISGDLYIKLSIDDLGSYDLKASAKLINFKDELIEGTHKIVVFEKNLWDPSLLNNDILYTETEPVNPSLDDLIENDKFKLEINGPSDLDVELKLRIHKQDERIETINKFPKLKSPISSNLWNKYFQENILNNAKNEKIYEELILCNRATFEFTAGNIGRSEITFESEIKPLQFKYTNVKNSINLYIIDMNRYELINEINAITFEKPDLPISIKVKDNKVTETSKGGLYFAKEIKDSQSFLIVPRTNFYETGLAKLLPPKIKLRQPKQTTEWVSNYIDYCQLWYSSKIIANRHYTYNWVKEILYQLQSHLSYCLCFDRKVDGNQFSKIDRKFRNLIKENKISEAKNLLNKLLPLISKNTNDQDYLLKMSNNFAEYYRVEKIEELFKYFKVIKGIHIERLDIDFSLLLNFKPENIKFQYGKSFNIYIYKLFKRPVIFRVIRFLILTDMLKINNEYQGLRPYGKNWQWTT